MKVWIIVQQPANGRMADNSNTNEKAMDTDSDRNTQNKKKKDEQHGTTQKASSKNTEAYAQKNNEANDNAQKNNEANAQTNEANAQKNERKNQKKTEADLSPKTKRDNKRATDHLTDSEQFESAVSENEQSAMTEQSETDNESNTLTPACSSLDDSQELDLLEHLEARSSETEETRKSKRLNRKDKINYHNLNRGKSGANNPQEGRQKPSAKIFKTQIELLREMTKSNQRETMELKEDKTKLREENKELREENKELKSEITLLHKQLTTQTEEIRKRKNIAKEAKDEQQNEREKIEKMETKEEEMRKEVENLKIEVDTYKRQQKERKTEVEAVRKENSKLTEELGSQRFRAAQNEAKHQKVIEDMEQKLKAKEEELLENTARTRVIESQLEDARTTLEEAQVMIDNLLDSQTYEEPKPQEKEETPKPRKKQKAFLIADSNGRQIIQHLNLDSTDWTTTQDIFTLDHLLEKLKDREAMVNWKYENVFISLGTNDIKDRKGTIETAKKILEAMRVLNKYSSAKVYYVQPPPLGDPLLNTEMAILQRQIAKKLEGQYIPNDLKNYPKSKTLNEDGIHITDLAAKIIATSIEERQQPSIPEKPAQKEKDEKYETELELETQTAKYVIRRRRQGLNEAEDETQTRISLKTAEDDERCVLAISGKRENVKKAIQILKKKEDECREYAKKKDKEIKDKQQREQEIKEQICEYYRRGSCRYGERCRMRHTLQGRNNREHQSPRRPRSSSSEDSSPNRKRRYNVY